MSGPWEREEDGAPDEFTSLIHIFLRKYRSPRIVAPNIPPGIYEVEFVFKSEDSTGISMEMHILRKKETMRNEQSES